MDEGRIPRRMPELRVVGGQGSDRPCAICGEPMGTTEAEIEVRVSDACYNVEIFHVHASCEAEWRYELGSSEPPVR